MKKTIYGGAICGAGRGRYGKPQSALKLKWVDIKNNKKIKCESNKHRSKKLWYPIKKMFYQEWELTEKELKEAIKAFDIFSLEMTGRFICSVCAKEEVKYEKNDTERI